MMHLLKKELSELLTKQMLISLVVSLAVMFSLGFIVSNTMSSEELSGDTIRIIDQDKTEFTVTVAESAVP